MRQPTWQTALPTLLALTLGLLAALAPGRAAGQQAQEEDLAYRFSGEELYFSVRLGDAEAARAGVSVGTVQEVGGRSVVPITAQARSVGFFDRVYELDDRSRTFVDPLSHRPLQSSKIFREKSRDRSYHVDYSHSIYQAQVEKRLPATQGRGERRHRYRRAIPGTTHDMVSWVYELRRVPDPTLGQRYTFYVFDGWKLSRLEAVFAAREDVVTPMGWFKTWRVDISREVLNSRSRRAIGALGRPTPTEPVLKARDTTRFNYSGSFWLSRDENLLPVKAAVDTPLGPAQAVLIKYEPSLQARHIFGLSRRGLRHRRGANDDNAS